ncbi:hypothetical protein CPB86DRAFT_57820 [Serendipita vermifera]|nr:hypothetical protein CPB86DRAFT_57820 [Serendipita vermifera]
MTASIPSQLTSLTLGLVSLTVDALPSRVPHSLPVLTKLELEDVNFDGPVRKYLRCPKVKQLIYRATADDIPLDSDSEEGKNHYGDLARQLFDAHFFKSVPHLETVSLDGLKLDGDLVTILQSCNHLQSLMIEDCQISEFLTPLTESFGKKESFPSVVEVRIDDSWPIEVEMTFDEFTSRCRVQRPATWISGNRSLELVEEHSDVEIDTEACL